MTFKQYKQARAVVALFIALTVSIATTLNNYTLAVVGVLTGMAFMIALRRRTKIVIDERIISISEKAARMTYSIVTPIIGIMSFLMYSVARSINPQLLWVAMTMSYVTLFLLGVYSFAYYFLYKKYGGEDEE